MPSFVYSCATTMNPVTHKRLTLALSLICLGLLVLGGCLFWNYAFLKIHVAFAEGQTRIFAAMREQARHSDPRGAAGCLQYVVNYYPSGTRQTTGSQLDRIVERDRAQAVEEIIASLRVKTGQDLGTDPSPWILKYWSK